MALTELQRPTKEDFYNTLRHSATEMNNLMMRWKSLAEGINMFGTADLDAMGVAAGQVRTDMVDYKTVLNELIAFFDGTATTQTKVPKTIINKIRAIK